MPQENDEKPPDTGTLSDELLKRVRDAAQSITERIRQLLEKYAPPDEQDEQSSPDS